jgi:DNA-binding MarR family transcriptional regulator
VPSGRPQKHVLDAARLREALRRFLRGSERLTRKHGLTTQRYELLLAVSTPRRGGLASLAELTERLSLAPSTVTELVQRSEDQGLVRRELQPENRRAVYVAPTCEGTRRLTAAAAALEDERHRLVSVLEQLAEQDTDQAAKGGRVRHAAPRIPRS